MNQNLQTIKNLLQQGNLSAKDKEELQDSIKDLEQKGETSEALRREFEIEEAMEEIRSRALAMHHSDELRGVLSIMFRKLLELKVLHGTVAIQLFDFETRNSIFWAGNDIQPETPKVNLPFDERMMKEDTCHRDLWQAMTEGKIIFNKFYTKEKKDKWFEYVFRSNDLITIQENTRKLILSAESHIVCFIPQKNSALFADSFDGSTYTEEELKVLIRASKVFEQAYVRFLDLEKAEAQARESEIQLALEKVRARTMAMHKSEEISEVMGEVFIRLKDLNVLLDTANLLIFSEGSDVVEAWTASTSGSYTIKFIVPLDSGAQFPLIADAIKKGENLYTHHYPYEEKNKFFNNLFTHTEYKLIPDERKKFILDSPFYSISVGISKNIAIQLNSYSREAFTKEENKILVRFTRVFEQAYTRFLDLQKAEEQAKESQVQLALERVRARTMAMHKSEELSETAVLLFEQLKSLGVNLRGCGFNIWEKDEKICTAWMNTPDGKLSASFQLPLTGDPLFKRYYESRQKGEDFWVQETGEKELIARYQYLATLPDLKEPLSKERRENVELPKFIVDHVVNFSHGNLIFITYEQCPEAWDIFKRFGNVFEQTYTRFRDLQKAEAQTREAQIEAALEKVRSTSLAMHSSQELQKVVNEIFARLKELDVHADSANILILQDQSKDIEGWTASPASGYNRTIFPYADYGFIKDFVANNRAGYEIFSTCYGKEEKDAIFRNLFEKTELGSISPERKEFILNADCFNVCVANCKSIGINVNRYTKLPYSDGDKSILQRFAKVFYQCYTRFLDLQKAEAQAREAQIEAALEKVRSTSLAMHSSQELQKVVNEIFARLKELNVGADSANIFIFQDQSKDFEGWTASPATGNERAIFPYGEYDVLKDWVDNNRAGIEIFSKVYTKKQKNDLFTYLFEKTKLGLIAPERREFILGSEIYNVCVANCKSIAINVNRYTNLPYSDDDKTILQRFAKVFYQCYTRFLDLQKAEAQAREGKIESALERVRSKAMAMHKSNDIASTTLAAFDELKKLGIYSLRCGVELLAKNSNSSEVYAVTNADDGTTQTIVRTLDMGEHESLKRQYNAWLEQEDFMEELKGEALSSYYKRPFFQRDGKQITTVDFTKPEYGYYFAFPDGLFYSWSDKLYFDDENEILKRFRSIIALTFRRFLDLQKAEMQARESQVQLALERVRARTMAMHRSEELAETAHVLFQQLIELGDIPDRISIGIVDEAKGIASLWSTDQTGSQIQNSFTARLNERTVIAKMYKAWKESRQSIIIDLEGNELNEWLAFVREEMKIPVNLEFIKNRRVCSATFFSHGWIMVATHEIPHSEIIQILVRFASVFNLTYRRFLDLQKAETQAREAQIEAALERVRYHAMAMQTSEDVGEATSTVFKELDILGVETFRCGIALVKGEELEVWSIGNSGDGHTVKGIGRVNIHLHPLWEKYVDAWLQKKEFVYAFLEGKEKEDYVRIINTSASYSLSQKNLAWPDLHFQAYYFAEGSIFAFSVQPHSEADKQVMRRFTNVFALTFRRYEDLKRAEAQAKEAKIEAALERVRSKAMAMHKSNDIAATASAAFEELKKLGIHSIRCGVGLLTKDSMSAQVYAATNADDGSIQTLVGARDMTEHATLTRQYNAWLEQRDIYEELKGEALSSYYKRLFFQVDGKEMAALDFTKPEYGYYFTFPDGLFYSWSDILYRDDEKEILNRFRSIIALTFRRFLDLQKAEAQAREAQIEAALERVRSRSMGMQKSEELKEVIHLVFEQFVHLNILVEHTGFIIDYKERDDMNIWLADQHEVPFQVTIPYFDCAHWNSFIEAKEKGKDFFTNYLSFEEKNKFYKDLFTLIPGVTDEAMKSYLSCPGLAISTVLLDNVGLYIENFSGIPYSDEDNGTLMRFGKVFQQTYTRFLDLQTAEAQAREAHIQLALERVRAKTMSMHNSDDVGETIATMFVEFKNLSIHTNRCGILIFSDEKIAEVWTARSTGEGNAKLIIGRLDLDAHKMLRSVYNAWKAKNEFFQYDLKDDDLIGYYNAINNLKFYPTKFDLAALPSKEFHSEFFFADGAVFSFTNEPVDESNANIMKRFAAVFSLTYRRYLDLQKAEAQAREAQIEAALEKVRSRSLAMHKSDELKEAGELLWIELGKLGIESLSSGYVLMDQEEKFGWFYAPNPATGKIDTPLGLSHTETKEMLKVLSYWKRQEPLSVIEMNEEETIAHQTYVAENGLQPDGTKSHWISAEQLIALSPKRLFLQNFNFKQGYLMIVGGSCLTDMQVELMLRFTKVFQQTYTRFLDLQKAEAQAREAQIQLALERVRARTMAMQHSEELPETAGLIFSQINALGADLFGMSFQLWNDTRTEVTCWTAGVSGVMLPFKLPIKADPVMINIIEAAKKGAKIYVEEMGGNELENHYKNLFAFPAVAEAFKSLAEAGIMLPRFQVFNAAFFNYGYLLFITLEACPNIHDLFLRFAKEFEQTYTRFLDLQKAEAQAREAQIEAALERVRSRTMAMHKSSEVTNIAASLNEELWKLGLQTGPQGGGSIMILSRETGDAELWTGFSEDKTLKSCHVPYFKHPFNDAMINAWKKGSKFLEFTIVGDEKKSLDDHYFATGFKDFPENDARWMKNLDSVTFSLAFMKYGAINWAPHPLTEEQLQILERFAKVFEQSYTRFLDLQKAEDQAREAQIEAALERVRSRSMGMQKSEEMPEVLQLIFKQISQLGTKVATATFTLDYKATDDFNCYFATPDQAYPVKFYIPYFDNPVFNDFKNGKKDGGGFFSHTHSLEEKNTFFNHLFQYSPAIPQSRRDFLLSSPGYATSVVLMDNIALGLINYEGEAYSENENLILRRFGKVFEQSYTRFLDLQKAEAHAKEAQIETALEKVRSRSLGMHKSEEIQEVVKSVIERLKELKIELNTAIIIVFKEDSKDAIWWMATKENYQYSSVLMKYRENAYFKAIENARSEGTDIFSASFSQKEKREIFDYFFADTDFKTVPDEQKKFILESKFFTISVGLTKNVGVQITSYTRDAFSEEEKEIVKRFANVFDQSYTRFLDLQKAEAQALEAIKRASVDRIRAEIASMRTTSDLERITPLIWNELTTLGVPFVRCGVFIMDESLQKVHSFLSTPEGKAIATLHIPFDFNLSFIANTVSYWRKKKIYKEYWDATAFANTWKALSTLREPSAATQSQEQPPEHLYLHQLPFLQGMLYVGNSAPLNENELQLVQNLAEAFSTAYARYEDFNKLEAAKKQVDSTLNELQATQKQLIQSEKMASLGELTAGIAHEIQNPLNFVNNFSEVNKELLAELNEEIEKGNFGEAKAIVADIAGNEDKISHHGKRADSIVKGMLQHSRSTSTGKEPTDINVLADEYLRLAYHGLRAKDKSFNVAMKTDYDNSNGKINLIPQDIGRVLLNLYNNAFYAVNEKMKGPLPLEGNKIYEPTVSITTRSIKPPSGSQRIEIIVSDNGGGIPQKVLDKIFQPFFTTKPTGSGTGLGLSLAYDIVKAHGGELRVESEEGKGAQFIVELPVG